MGVGALLTQNFFRAQAEAFPDNPAECDQPTPLVPLLCCRAQMKISATSTLLLYGPTERANHEAKNGDHSKTCAVFNKRCTPLYESSRCAPTSGHSLHRGKSDCRQQFRCAMFSICVTLDTQGFFFALA